jgi:ABC-type antimicrobial peptide transport system permease subunit
VRWRDAVALAGRGVVRRPGRTILTALAVVLAAALLVALLTIAATARTRVLDQITKGGPLAGINVDGPNLDPTAILRIEHLPGVVSVSPVMAAEELVIAPDPPVFGAEAHGLGDPFPEGVVGVDLRRADRFPISLIAGRLPAVRAGDEVAVTVGYLTRVGLDKSRAASVLGTEIELGAGPSSSALHLRGNPFGAGSIGPPAGAAGRWTRATVVGVVAQDAGPGDILAPIENLRAAFRVGAPDAQPRFAALMVRARDLNEVTAVRERIGELGYDTIASETLLANVERYVRVVEIVLAGIGVIALVIAALGIGNAILASIRERRREIGVMKAIGARNRDVLRVFLIEAAAVGVVGGLLGTLAGWGAAEVVDAVVNRYLGGQGLAAAPLVFPWGVAVGGILGSTILAVAAGAGPSIRASRLPAAEAMEGA